MSRLVILLLLLNTLPVSGGTFPASVVKGMVVTKATIDGQQVNVILDSGAPGFVLNEKYYASAKGEISCSGINGAFRCKTYMIDSWEWLGVQAGKTRTLVSDLSYLEDATKQPIHAIIGLSVLNDYYVTINFDQQQVYVQKEIPASLEAAFTRFTYVDHLPVISCQVNGERKMLGLDTGSAANYLFGFDGKNSGVNTANFDPVIVVGNGNIESLKHRIHLELDVPQSEMPILTSFIVDLKSKSAFLPTGFDGLLGQEFLSQYNMIIHPGRQRLLLLPRDGSSLVMQ